MHIAQIGCGLMGSALARILAQGGEVLVWNRTPSRAEALVAANIRVADDVSNAVAGSELVILSLSDYQAARETLDTVSDWSGTTLVNLITGAPHEAEEFEAWAAERDIPYLDGTILSYPAQIGTPDAVIAYAGPRALWEQHASRLTPLAGTSRHVSEAIRGGNVFETAVDGAFFNPALGAFVEAAAYAKAADLDVEALRDGALSMLPLLRACIEEACEAIIAGDFSTDQATLDVYAAATKTWSDTLVAAGQHARYAQALDENMRAALAAGHGPQGFYAQYLVARNSS